MEMHNAACYLVDTVNTKRPRVDFPLQFPRLTCYDIAFESERVLRILATDFADACISGTLDRFNCLIESSFGPLGGFAVHSRRITFLCVGEDFRASLIESIMKAFHSVDTFDFDQDELYEMYVRLFEGQLENYIVELIKYTERSGNLKYFNSFMRHVVEYTPLANRK